MAFAICRVATLNGKSRGKGSVGGSVRHLDYHLKAAEISRPELTQFNRSFVLQPPTFKQMKAKAQELVERHNKAVDKYNEEHPTEKQRRHFRKDSKQFIEVILTYSPEAEEYIDRDRWVKKSIDFLKDEFLKKGCIPIRCDLHCDETTTHISFIGLAWSPEEQKAGARDVLGDSRALCELQDRYADTVAEFGLQRGYSRYREYDRIRKRAEAHGYSDVKQFAQDYGLEIPKYRGHKPIGEWKAELNEKGMSLERHIRSLRQTVEDLEHIKAELGSFIPERYIEVVQNCETYEKLLQIGKKIDILVDGRNLTITDYLQELAHKDLQRIKDLDISL